MDDNKKSKITDHARKAHELRMGIEPGVDESARPVSGYLVNRSQDAKRRKMAGISGPEHLLAPLEIEEGDPYGTDLNIQGDIEVVLKPGVSRKTSYVRGDSVSSGGRAVAMNSDNQDDILNAIIHDDGPDAKKSMARTMIGLLKASLDDDNSGITAMPDSKNRLTPVDKDDPSASERETESFEAMILGGFNIEDVEGIHFPYSKIKKIAEDEDVSDFLNSNFIASRLKRLNSNAESARIFSSLPPPSKMKTESIVALKEYRAAKRIKKMYEKIGVEYIKIAHPKGVNIEDPRSYDKNASALVEVESILKAKITKEIDSEIQKMFNDKPGNKRSK
jgi:hypothetical protein